MIDARNHLTSLGRYANDAKGLKRQKGLRNNAAFINLKGKIYLQATSTIPAGSETLVSYGREYWDAIKYNINLKS